jgi:hypothetical protein
VDEERKFLIFDSHLKPLLSYEVSKNIEETTTSVSKILGET